MKKTIISSLALAICFTADLAAQTPSAASQGASGHRPAAEVMGHAGRDEFEYKQFAAQVRKLRDGLENADFNKAAALLSTLTNSMRREIGQARQQISEKKNVLAEKKAAPRTEAETARAAQKNAADRQAEKHADPENAKASVARMDEILAEFQGFIFKAENRAESEKKLKLLEEFGKILQKNMVEEHVEAASERQASRD